MEGAPVIRRVIALLLFASCAMAGDYEWGIGQLDHVTRGLVSYWAMRNSGTTVYDEWGSKHGAAHNGVTFGADYAVVNDGAWFNGTNGYISVGEIAAFTPLTGDRSWSFWMKKEDSALSFLFGSYREGPPNSGLSVQGYATTNRIYGYIRDGSSNYRVRDNVISANAWLFIVITWAGSTDDLNIYVNGSSAGQGTVNAAGTVGSVSPVYETFIGARNLNGVPNGHMMGRIDEFRAHNRVLSADEIKQLYRMGATIYQNR
jgi:hypothetical protein